MTTQQQQPSNARPPAPPTTPAKPAGRMSLQNVVRGKLQRSMRIFLYGVDKIGKSTFGAGAPSPIFIGTEDGTAELDVERFPEPRSIEDIGEAIDTLLNSAHDYKSLVIDTLDWMEPFIWRVTCAKGDPSSKDKGPKKNIEDFGFGKGYDRAVPEWRALLARLDALRVNRKMHIILLAHAHVKTFKNPLGDDFDRYEPKINVKASAVVKEWADAIMFAQHETGTVMKGEGAFAKARGISTGARYIYNKRTAGYDAGNRYGLPDKLPLNWDDFETAVRAGTPDDPAKLALLITSLLAQVDDETRGKAETWLALGQNRTNPIALSQLADRLRGKLSIIKDNASTDDNVNEENKNQ